MDNDTELDFNAMSEAELDQYLLDNQEFDGPQYRTEEPPPKEELSTPTEQPSPTEQPPPTEQTQTENRGIFPLIKRDLPNEDVEEIDTTPKGTIITSGLSHPGEHFERVFQGISTAGLGLVDFGIDATTTVLEELGADWAPALDDQWDKMTRL